MRWGLLTFLILLGAGAAHAAPDTVRVETDHYVLLAEAEEDAANEYAAVLEAAWPEYREFFGAEPDLPEGEKMKVVFTETQEAFEAALRADRQPVPASGGYYSPSTRTAYLWRQPTLYYTRCLLLHEAAHQFHYLSRTGNRSIPIGWYVEGIAEYLCRHRWDGEKMELGVLPSISLKDYAAAAREEVRAGTDVADEEALAGLSRPVSWALIRFLATGPHASRFSRLRDRFDRGGGSASALYRTVGGARRLRDAFAKWLEAEQEPWRQVFNQWEETAPGRIRGVAAPGIVSFCRPKETATRLSAKLEIPEGGDWTGGLLLAHEDNDNYTVALIFGGKALHVNRRRAGRWHPLLRAEVPPPTEPGLLALEAVWRNGIVTLTVEGKRIDTFKLESAALGLCLQGGTARYRNVDWE